MEDRGGSLASIHQVLSAELFETPQILLPGHFYFFERFPSLYLLPNQAIAAEDINGKLFALVFIRRLAPLKAVRMEL